MAVRLRLLITFSLNFLILQLLWAKDAFIIIDMQPVFITRFGYDADANNQKKIDEILEKQIESIRKAREAGIPIVVVEYEHVLLGDSKTHDKLMRALEGNDFFLFKKDSDGAFDSSRAADLKNFLTHHQVDNLIISGANGGACVFHTISGAMKCGYKVTAIDDLIADFNYKSFIYPYSGHYEEFNRLGPFGEYGCFQSYLNNANMSLNELAAKIPK